MSVDHQPSWISWPTGIRGCDDVVVAYVWLGLYGVHVRSGVALGVTLGVALVSFAVALGFAVAAAAASTMPLPRAAFIFEITCALYR